MFLSVSQYGFFFGSKANNSGFSSGHDGYASMILKIPGGGSFAILERWDYRNVGKVLVVRIPANRISDPVALGIPGTIH